MFDFLAHRTHIVLVTGPAFTAVVVSPGTALALVKVPRAFPNDIMLVSADGGERGRELAVAQPVAGLLKTFFTRGLRAGLAVTTGSIAAFALRPKPI